MYSDYQKKLQLFFASIKHLSILFLFFVLFAGIVSFAQQRKEGSNTGADSVLTARREMIHKRSSLVMPFNMNKVTHYFIKTDNGGILRIISKSGDDPKQVKLIREHLHKEQHLFSAGDFRDPKTLHGINMPGLKILTKSNDKYRVLYKEIRNGAQLSFTSEDTTVVNALHTWFAAQLRDHGSDARSHEK